MRTRLRRKKLLMERFAQLGRMLRGEPVEGGSPRGMAGAAKGHDSAAGAPRKPRAALSLARKGWMGFANSQAPHGELSKRVQVQWIRVPIPVAVAPKLKVKRGKKRFALTAIGEKAEVKKLPKLPPKYHWQA